MMPKRIKFHASFLYDQLISPLQPLPNIMFEDCINYFSVKSEHSKSFRGVRS